MRIWEAYLTIADAIDSGVCSLIGLGRSVVLQPDLPKAVLLDQSIPDEEAFAIPHIVRGQWFANIIPVEVVGARLAIQFFDHNMRRLGNGSKADTNASISYIVFRVIYETFESGFWRTMARIS